MWLKKTGASAKTVSDAAFIITKNTPGSVGTPATYAAIQFDKYSDSEAISMIQDLIRSSLAAGVSTNNSDYIGNLQSRLYVLQKLNNP